MIRAPMHVDPHHPMWARVPAGMALFLTVLGLVYVYDLVATGDHTAWLGIVVTFAGAGMWGECYLSVRRERR